MSIAITKWVADTQKAMAEGELPSLKRTFNAALADTVKKMPMVTKRRCMDGSLQTPCVVGVPATIIFPQTLFDTENCVSVPLPFFLNKNLRYITDKAATLPTIKSNPLAGDTKGINIIDSVWVSCEVLLRAGCGSSQSKSRYYASTRSPESPAVREELYQVSMSAICIPFACLPVPPLLSG